MSDYFALPLEGAGTVDIESLGSYLCRFSYLHGVSVWQCVDHLSSWYRAVEPGHKGVPHYLLYARSMAICAHGADVKKLVAILELATGLRGLRAATFLALENVTTRRCSGLVKHSRYWCPACFTGWKHEGRPCFDKLQWSAHYIMRCIEHEIELMSACPQCGKKQKYYSTTIEPIEFCRYCGQLLTGQANRWIRSIRPTFGEKETLGLIEEVSKNPEIKFIRDALRRYICALRDYSIEKYLPESKEVRYLYRLMPRTRTPLPALINVLRAATSSDVPLTLLLSSPESAAKIACMNPTWNFRGMPAYRPTHDNLLKSRVGKVLRAVVKGPVNVRLLSMQKLALSLGVSTGYLRYHYPKLCEKLSLLRDAQRVRAYTRQRTRIRRLLLDTLLPGYEQGQWHSHDELVDEIVKAHGVSKHRARIELNRVLTCSLGKSSVESH